MAEFNLADLLKDAKENVPGSGTNQETLERIAYDLLAPDENNGYSMDGIDELARSIEIAGLQQPLRVRPIEGGKYRILSGHRRHAAIGKLIENSAETFADGVPCIVDQRQASAALQELQLLLANADNRKMTAADDLQQAERISDCIRRLEDEGFEFPGRHREWVAKLSGMSRTKLGRLEAIKNNLEPQLLRAFRCGKINETVADLLQKLPKAGQIEIAEYCSRVNDYSKLNSAAAEHCLWNAEKFMQSARCGDGDVCDHHARRFVQPFRTNFHWQYCDGGCCLSCSQLSSCPVACAKGKAKAKTVAADVKAEKEKAEKNAETARKRQQTIYKNQRQKEAQRLLPVIEAAGLGDDDTLTGRYGFGGTKISDIKNHAAGEFGDSYFYDNSVLPTNVHDLADWADALNCSLDFLAGRTDEPRNVPGSGTKAEWMYEEKPPKDGRYLCLIDMGDDMIHEQRCDWRLGGWYCYSQPVDEMFRVMAWWPLPPEVQTLPKDSEADELPDELQTHPV